MAGEERQQVQKTNPPNLKFLKFVFSSASGAAQISTEKVGEHESRRTGALEHSFPIIGVKQVRCWVGGAANNGKFSFTSPADVIASQKRLISLPFATGGLIQRIKVHPQSGCAPSDQELRRFP